MGLDEWTQEEESNNQGEQDDSSSNNTNLGDPNEADSTKRTIAANIQSRLIKGQFDGEIDSGEVTINIEDMAMMFAVMTMDFQESDFDDLVTDGM